MLETRNGRGVFEIDHILVGLCDFKQALAGEFAAPQRDTLDDGALLVNAGGSEQSRGR